MHITYNQLLENTAKHMLLFANPVEFSTGRFNRRWQRDAVREQVKELKKALDKDPEKKRCALDQCKYGRERAIRLSILRRRFEI